jgi:hypothetical protein
MAEARNKTFYVAQPPDLQNRMDNTKNQSIHSFYSSKSVLSYIADVRRLKSSSKLSHPIKLVWATVLPARVFPKDMMVNIVAF